MRESIQAGEGQRERERGRRGEIPSRLRAVSAEPDAGLPANCEIMTCAEIKSLTRN